MTGNGDEWSAALSPFISRVTIADRSAGTRRFVLQREDCRMTRCACPGLLRGQFNSAEPNLMVLPHPVACPGQPGNPPENRRFIRSFSRNGHSDSCGLTVDDITTRSPFNSMAEIPTSLPSQTPCRRDRTDISVGIICLKAQRAGT
jgi:hypothetical protein